MIPTFLSLAFLVAPPTAVQESASVDLEAAFRWLDRDGDGRISRFEGSEAFLFLCDEADESGDGGLDLDELVKFFAREREESRAELAEVLAGLDVDGDGALDASELPPELASLRGEIDSNGDGLLALDELTAVRIDALFARMEGDQARFRVEGSRAFMSGVIGPSTPGRVLELILVHPRVEEIWMEDVPGSIDDDSNLRAARLVRRFGLATVAPGDAVIASGGTDFFLAGEPRAVEAGARIGVHSWGGFEEDGDEVALDDPAHAMYVEYYAEMGVPEDFYWFTLDAAPAEGIHWMTPDELERYGVSDRVAGEVASARDTEDAYGLDAIDVTPGPRGIVPLPDSVNPAIRAIFDRYARVTAPSGRPIHVLAQSGWSEDQIARARAVLGHFLTDVPGSRWGADKRAVAEAMAANRATLVLFDNVESMEHAFDGELGELALGMQDLRANECPVEGSSDYLLHETRDAAFEEILHLVHDYGIRPALEDYDGEIQRANDEAAARGFWHAWPEDEPDSHRNEYIAAVYDNYLDLWTVPPKLYEGQVIEDGDIPRGTSHFGTYGAGSRARLAELDPAGFALVEAFFPDGLLYTAELPVDFRGKFTLLFDPRVPYTAKSRHLTDVTLRGGNPAALVGNDRANRLTGNHGDNRLEGRGGDDTIDGGPGFDTVYFRGISSEYVSRLTPEGVVITDRVSDRDGTDLLRFVESLSFADGLVETRTLR